MTDRLSSSPQNPDAIGLMINRKKFEMRIDIPNAIRLNRKRFEANICARYLIWNKEVIIKYRFRSKIRGPGCLGFCKVISINGNMLKRSIHLVDPGLLAYFVR